MLSAYGSSRQRHIELKIRSLCKYSLNPLLSSYLVSGIYICNWSLSSLWRSMCTLELGVNNKPNKVLLVSMCVSSRRQSLFLICCTMWRTRHQLTAPGSQFRATSVRDCRESSPVSFTSSSSDWQTPLTGKACPNIVKILYFFPTWSRTVSFLTQILN